MKVSRFVKLLNDRKVPKNASIAWYRNQARKVTKVSPSSLVYEKGGNLVSKVQIGKMYMFYYDPKYKDELPYWDKFPVIFPFAVDKTGFYGLNMHYLPHTLRAKLMDALYEFINDEEKNRSTFLKLSYSVLLQASTNPYFKPCVKRYLHDHVRSDFVKVEAKDWDIALFLPLERFQKASASEVYRDSVRKLK